jgi:hypothetical protein
MFAEQSHPDLSPRPVAPEAPVWSDEQVTAALEEVVATFDEEHRAEVRDLVEGMFNLAVLDVLNALPEAVQSEYLARLSATAPAADGQTPLTWLLATAEPLRPGLTQELQQALERVKAQIADVMASPDEASEPAL